MANVLIVGKRRSSYQAALKLNHTVYVWSDGELGEKRKKRLAGWLEDPFNDHHSEISVDVYEKIQSFNLNYVIAATESSVDLAAMIRRKFNLPGTPLEVSNRLHNKHVMKNQARKHGIPVTDFKLIAESDSAEDLVKLLGLPLVVKPVAESGARGVVVAKTTDAVQKYMAPGLLAEPFVDDKEVSVETFVKDGKAIFHNITDYLHQWQKSILPANLAPSLADKVIEINDQVIEHFNVQSGMTHSEFYLSEKGPIFGEMAVRPPGGYYMNLIELAYGFNPWKTYVEIETNMPVSEITHKPSRYAAVYMIHPGSGTVKRVEGSDEVKNIPEVDEFKFKIQKGDAIPPHESTSSECGHVLMSSKTEKKLFDAIKFIENTLKIEI